MINFIRKIKKDKRGSTTLELVTTMVIMLIVLPLMIIMISSSLNTKAVANLIMSNTLSSSGAQTSLNNDIETASAIKVVDGEILNLRSQEGVCKTWKIQDNNLVRSQSDFKIADDSTWVIIGDNFSPLDTITIFEKDSTGTVGYNFKIGKDETVTELKGAATQSAAGSGSAQCW
jgi:hypothetical protein